MTAPNGWKYGTVVEHCEGGEAWLAMVVAGSNSRRVWMTTLVYASFAQSADIYEPGLVWSWSDNIRPGWEYWVAVDDA